MDSELGERDEGLGKKRGNSLLFPRQNDILSVDVSNVKTKEQEAELWN